MHLIFASSLVPCGAPESGFDIANHAIVGAMRRAGVRVTHFGFKWPGAELADPENTIVLAKLIRRQTQQLLFKKLSGSQPLSEAG